MAARTTLKLEKMNSQIRRINFIALARMMQIERWRSQLTKRSTRLIENQQLTKRQRLPERINRHWKRPFRSSTPNEIVSVANPCLHKTSCTRNDLPVATFARRVECVCAAPQAVVVAAAAAAVVVVAAVVVDRH